MAIFNGYFNYKKHSSLFLITYNLLFGIVFYNFTWLWNPLPVFLTDIFNNYKTASIAYVVGII